ncbi:glutamyl tRNA(Gln) amidotransferase subunit C [Trichuris trichiura]|uniref:Glutamyl tRNA(Gln) amidotransferase subunit C n=1 Tax=Trichuris trichiura TaxID=36087 RepID=A0A077YWY6_TRITR|nr:glutamyl tRNA(Gln) amidotransferase subunit C [Trichuris trichiura]
MALSRLLIASKGGRCAGLARQFCKSSVDSVFPKGSVWREIDKDSLPPLPKLDDDLLHLLEEQSLVRFDDKAALWHLQKAIEYANQLHAVDTDNVEPMYTLSDDCPTEMIERTELLSNAAVSCEGYFVAPPGNVPLEKNDVQVTDEDVSNCK